MLASNYLSPIDDYSNLPFRLLCQRYGAEATCVPLVNSTAIARNTNNLCMVDAHEDEKNIGVQLVGNDPAAIGIACETISKKLDFVSWFNLNCGCPSVRTMSSGGGSAMLCRPDLISLSVEAMRKATDKPVSVKIRIKTNLAETVAICKVLEKSGADFVIVHGRTASQGYSGKSDWELIRSVKELVGIPVVGNGDIRSIEEGATLVNTGYFDSYMVARAAMGNPELFSGHKSSSYEDKAKLLREYLAIHSEYLGEPELRDMKLKAVNMINGVPDASSVRNAICRAKSLDDILKCV